MATTSNFGWTTPDDTDLVKDGAAAIRTLGSNIDTSLVDLKGGTSGQILSKNSNTDLDYAWITNDVGDITEVQAGTGISVASGTGPIPVVTSTVATTFDAKGDLVVGTGADTFAKLTVGTNGHTLVADSGETTGLKWAAASSGSMTLLDTLTFNGSASITSATLSGSYNDLVIYVMDYAAASNDQFLNFRFNSDTGSNYGSFSVRFSSVGSNFGPSGGFAGTSLPAMDNNNAGISSTSADNISAITVYNYANSVATGAHKLVNIFNKHTNSTTKGLFNAVGAWENTNAITTVTFFNTNSQNFSAGNAYIYGVK
jgi:hypothetical protein